MLDDKVRATIYKLQEQNRVWLIVENYKKKYPSSSTIAKSVTENFDILCTIRKRETHLTIQDGLWLVKKKQSSVAFCKSNAKKVQKHSLPLLCETRYQIRISLSSTSFFAKSLLFFSIFKLSLCMSNNNKRAIATVTANTFQISGLNQELDFL